MTVYIDELKRYPRTVSSGSRRYINAEWCHMTADTVDELHEMAIKIGMKREWFQNHGFVPHYDLMKNKRALAVNKGAEFKTARKQAVERIEAKRHSNG